ncbi:MAG: lamin tail domain-containing protein [Ardenticatenaceae bacterium]|nr:lamin tail domain-containing protein [Ardenticatenaceae bacterium]
MALLLHLMQSNALAAAPQAVVINEIAWMGTTTSFNDEWIELYNTTDAPIDLTGWTLIANDGTPTIALSGSIPADGTFLLERTDDTTVPGVTADLIYSGSLGNDGEYLILKDGASVVIDAVDSSGGWFSGHNEGRVPMVRLDTAVSGSIPSNWTYNPRCGSATNSAGISHTCVLTETAVGTGLDYQVYFNELAPTAGVITTTPTNMETALLALINNANTSLDMAIYGLNRQSIIDGLIAAHTRGVTVRVVGDDEAATASYQPYYQMLTDAGIPIVTDASLSIIQHNKFLVIDGQTVWTGSTNWTDTGFTLNANNSMVITDTILAAIYTTEFEEMWGGNFQGAKTDNTAHLFNFNGLRLESYFSPTDLVAFEVWDELAQADETIHFAMFFWTDALLTNRVIERLEAGVSVQGMFDQLGEANGSSGDEAMCAAGAQIGIESSAGKLHDKFAIIDVNGSDPTVILGSYNWTESGAYSNDENTLIIHDATLAQMYYAEWQRQWAEIELANICNPDTLYLPVIIRGD